MQDPATLYKIQPVDAEAVRPLRHRVLRADQPFEATRYPADGDGDAFHLALVPGDVTTTLEEPDGKGPALWDGDPAEIVGIASFYIQIGPIEDPRMPTLMPRAHWRLRGMAIAPELQGKGLGGRLLRAGIDGVARREGSTLWCNARESAVDFYKRQGFEVTGEPFDIEGIGPHRVMWRTVW